MRRILGLLAIGLAATTGSASRAEAQVNFSGSTYVCFEDALISDCNPAPAVLGGFGGSWSRFVNPGGTQLTFQGYGFNGTTDAVTGWTNTLSFGDGSLFANSFTGTFYLGIVFNTPTQASTLVFTGNATTQNDQLFIDFTSNTLNGTYGGTASPFVGELNDFSLLRGANGATQITGRLGVLPTTAVPEPSTTVLLTAGLVLLGVVARRPRRNPVV